MMCNTASIPKGVCVVTIANIKIILSFVVVHYYVMQETWAWSLMETVPKSNGHDKEESKLKLLENGACMYAFNIVNGFFAMKF